MAELIYLEIGGINFAIHNDISGDLQIPEPAYRSFIIRQGLSTKPVDFSINLRKGRAPKTESLKKIFDPDQAWSIFQNGNDYLLTIGPADFKEPYLTAFINEEFTQSEVYLSKDLLNESSLLTNPVCYPLDQILLIYILSRKCGSLLHAAGIGIKGEGYIFPGKSGAGKSTITRQFAGFKDIDLLSDDRIVVRKADDGFAMYGTPWPGEAGFSLNKGLPLSGILFIAHGNLNNIKELSPKEALKRALPVISIPWYDREATSNILNFCEELISKVPAYELSFKPNVEVADFIKQFVKS